MSFTPRNSGGRRKKEEEVVPFVRLGWMENRQKEKLCHYHRRRRRTQPPGEGEGRREGGTVIIRISWEEEGSCRNKLVWAVFCCCTEAQLLAGEILFHCCSEASRIAAGSQL